MSSARNFGGRARGVVLFLSRPRAGGSRVLLRILRSRTRTSLRDQLSLQALPELGARTRRSRAAFRRLVLHDYALQQPLIRAGCKRPMAKLKY